MCVYARVHAYTLLLGPGVSPPGPGIFSACLSVSVMADRVLVARPYPGPWLVSSLCGLQVWLWSSQSCSVIVCPSPTLPVSPSPPCCLPPPLLLMGCSSLVPGQAFKCPLSEPQMDGAWAHRPAPGPESLAPWEQHGVEYTDRASHEILRSGASRWCPIFL